MENKSSFTQITSKIQSIFPVQNYEIYEMYNKARSCFWIEKELDLSKDKYDWDNKLNDDERFFLSNILAFFAQSDQIVNINLEERFMNDVESLPTDMKLYIKLFYNFQKMMEDIHSITYESLLDTYITNNNQKNNFAKITQHISKIEFSIIKINQRSESIANLPIINKLTNLYKKK